MRPGRLSVLAGGLLALGILSAGCGGSKNAATTTTGSPTPSAAAEGGAVFKLAEVERCINAEAGMTAAPFRNTLISGTGGELRVKYPNPGLGWIFIAFGKDADEAKRIHDKAVDIAVAREHLPRATVLAGVEVNGNVFYYSDAGPLTAIDRRRVDACLR